MGFIDTGLTPALVDPRIYVSHQAIVDMGRLYGLPDAAEWEATRADLFEMAETIAELRATNVDLRRDLEAAEWTLERKFKAVPARKPGRPKVTA